MAVIGDANLPAFEQDVRVGFIRCSAPQGRGEPTSVSEVLWLKPKS